jgi:hypothetical protein
MMSIEQLHSHAARIRASGVLGRSETLLRLFDFFVDRALDGAVPKEIEVALEVFGRPPTFNVAQDAVVRVYIHKLRRKLDEYYAGPGKDDAGRLVMPKAEYRFVWQERPDVGVDLTATDQPPPAVPARAAPQHRLTWVLGGIIAVLLVSLFILARRSREPLDTRVLMEVRANPVWSRMLDDERPIFIVVGDYYIFGQLDDNGMEVQRLVRDFDINSALDLERHLKNNPELAGKYQDMSLGYLPTSVAFAMRDVMPLLEPNNKSARAVQVVMASSLTLSMVNSAHIIYIGQFSGMGVLREIVFSGSHFRIGDSYDELFDLNTQRRYISQEQTRANSSSSYLDYAIFSARTLNSGNELVVLAGTRDVAVMHVAEVATNASSLQDLAKRAGAGKPFEALFSVKAMESTSLGGSLTALYPLIADKTRGLAVAPN